MNSVVATPTDKPQIASVRQLWVGVAVVLSYLGLIGNGMFFRWLFDSQYTNGMVITRELVNLGMVVLIGWVVLRVEKRPLASIGLHTRNFGKSLAWSILIAAACLGTAILIMLILQAFGGSYGDPKAFFGLSPWTVTLITLRAGIAEEFMMRGYLLNRIEEWTGSSRWAVILTLVPFALLHYTQGPAGILISFVLGGILTAFYVWKRDLKSNIVAHFLVDFLANVVLAGDQ